MVWTLSEASDVLSWKIVGTKIMKSYPYICFNDLLQQIAAKDTHSAILASTMNLFSSVYYKSFSLIFIKVGNYSEATIRDARCELLLYLCC